MCYASIGHVLGIDCDKYGPAIIVFFSLRAAFHYIWIIFLYIGRRIEINKPLDTRIYQHVSALAVFKDYIFG